MNTGRAFICVRVCVECGMWFLLPLACGTSCLEVTEEQCKYNASFEPCGWGLGSNHLAGQPQTPICQSCDYLTVAMGITDCSFVPQAAPTAVDYTGPPVAGPPPPCPTALAIYNQVNCEAMHCCLWDPDALNALSITGFCRGVMCPTISPSATPTFPPTVSSPTAAPTAVPSTPSSVASVPITAPRTAPRLAPSPPPSSSTTSPGVIAAAVIVPLGVLGAAWYLWPRTGYTALTFADFS